MTQQHLIMCHGFASSARSSKTQFLQQKLAAAPGVTFHAFDFNPEPVDFEYLTVTGMINRLRQYVLDRQLENVSLIGSSLGALVALHYVRRYGRIGNLLLLAPLLAYFEGSRDDETAVSAAHDVEQVMHYSFGRPLPLRQALDVDGQQYRDRIPPPAPAVLLHGRSDEVISVAHSERYAATYSHDVTLYTVDSEHTLSNQHPFILTLIERHLLV